MSTPKIVSRDEWLAARAELLALEKEHTERSDALAKKRQALPWVEVNADYRFEGADGPVAFADLFGAQKQLLVYHFMYSPKMEKPCPSCSFWADHFEGARHHLVHRDVRMVAVSLSPFERLAKAADHAGWTFPWYSSAGSSFNVDFGVTFDKSEPRDPPATYNYRPAPQTDGEMPGLSAYIRDDGRIFHTYSAFSRGLEPLNAAYGALDLMPKGRDEDGLDWPMAWVRRLAEERTRD